MALGLSLSWLVAIGHWALVEAGQFSRIRSHLRVDSALSGEAIVERIDRAVRGRPSRGGDPPDDREDYVTIAYGWPIANWGTVFRSRYNVPFWQVGIEPVFGVDVTGLWAGGSLPDPYQPDLTQELLAQRRASGQCVTPSTTGRDPFERILPVFPLFAHSLASSLLYGLPFFVFFKWRESHRGGHCDHCGFSLAGLPPGAVCPECGKPFVESSAAGTAARYSADPGDDHPDAGDAAQSGRSLANEARSR